MRDYSREEILSMEVGRELDALVAEKVMGLDVVGPNRDKINSFPGWVWMVNYSTDISAAWQVIEKMCEKENVKFAIDFNYSVKGKWNGGLSYNNGSYAGYSASNAPESICKAALLAVME